MKTSHTDYFPIATWSRILFSLALLWVVALPLSAQGRRMTSFSPVQHGFQFSNTFKNNFISELDIRTGGLCGGMVYASLDYYLARKPIPKQTHRPQEGSTLHQYIYDRQVHSLVPNADKWAELGFNPFGARNSEFFNWGLQGFGGGRLQELKSRIDRGIPVPLGLYGAGGQYNGKEHQVLAIGYDCGRYRGDLKNYKDDLKIYVYDPNHPRKIMILRPDLRKQVYYYSNHHERKEWRSYFVDMKYRQRTPPTVSNPGSSSTPSGKADHLLFSIKTGGDDLRGGNDNLNITIYYKNGSQQTINNVNRSRRWIDHYTQNVSIKLNRVVAPNEISRIVLSTTFRGGFNGDNWNMDKLVIQARGNRLNQTIFEREGKPLKRFTGSSKTFTVYPR